MSKADRLYDELMLINDDSLREFTRFMLEMAPDYWWTVEASELHHPLDERKKGGRVLHARRCVKLANDLVKTRIIKEEDRDIMVSASLLHDICVRGLDGNCPADMAVMEHPLLVLEVAYPIKHKYASSVWFHKLFDVIASHMGQWGPVPFPGKTGYLSIMFHLVDYIVSRDFVKIEVD